MAITEEQRKEITFFDPTRERGRKIKFKHTKKWRGDHSKCNKHRSGVCVNPHAWKVVHGTWEIVPDFAIVNMERNALGTITDEGPDGGYAEPVWKVKGWLDVEDAANVSPSDDVKVHIINRLVTMKKIDLEHAKASYETVEKECKRLREAAEKANGLKAAKSDG